jgi:hypothetical protein
MLLVLLVCVRRDDIPNRELMFIFLSRVRTCGIKCCSKFSVIEEFEVMRMLLSSPIGHL